MGDLKFVLQDDGLVGTKIKVIGVGGGGSNSVSHVMEQGVPGVDYYIVNTDVQALNSSPVASKVAIGAKLTNGRGVGARPEIARQAALEDTDRIIEILEGADMVFIAAGFGGGTGTGATSVIASLAKELNALTVAVITKPFDFEGESRRGIAAKGLAELMPNVDALITIPNQRLLDAYPDSTLVEAFRRADDVLMQAVQSVSEIITKSGLINRDFADIKGIMTGGGFAVLGSATAKGPKAAVEAARQAIDSPLMEEGGVLGARALLINIAASKNLPFRELSEACDLINKSTGNREVQMNWGLVFDEALEADQVKVTVIATGFDRTEKPKSMAAAVGADFFQTSAQAHHAHAANGATTNVFEASAGQMAAAAASRGAHSSAELQAGEWQVPAVQGGHHEASAGAAEVPASLPLILDEEPPATNSHHGGEPPRLLDELFVGDDIQVPAFLRRNKRTFQ